MCKRLSIIIGNAAINNGNRGCVALSISAMYILDKVLSEKSIEYVFYLCDSEFQNNGEHVYDFVDKQIKFYSCQNIGYRNFKSRIKILLKTILHSSEMRYSKKVFRDADYILNIGAGDSFADIYGEGRFYQIDRVNRAARRYKKPYCLLPQTIGPFKNENILHQAVKSIEKSKLVMARDTQSFEYVKQIASKQQNIGEYIDVAFFLPYKKRDFDKNLIHVGLNISALLWHGGYTQDNQFGLSIDYQHTVRMIIDYFLSMPNVIIHLIPHVVHAEREIENDYAVSYDLYREYNNPQIVLAELFLSPIDAKSYISGMDFFMGARMHSTIAAFSSCVPVVPMAYSRKFNGLFSDTLQYSYLTDMKTDTESRILEIIKEAFTNRENIKTLEQEQMHTTVAKAGVKFEKDICKFMNI